MKLKMFTLSMAACLGIWSAQAQSSASEDRIVREVRHELDRYTQDNENFVLVI